MLPRVALLAVLAALLAAPAAAGAEPRVLLEGPGVVSGGDLSAYGGTVVWSTYDQVAQRLVLMRWHRGVVSTLPVRTGGAFEFDVGPDAAGRAVVVYSSCRSALGQTGASDCHLRSFRLDDGRDRPLRRLSRPAGDESNPSIWRGAVAFTRRRQGETVDTLHLSRPGTRRVTRLRGGTANKGDTAFVADIDLGPGSLAFTWANTSFGGHAGYETWAVDIRRGRRTLLGLGELGEGNEQRAFGLNAGRNNVLWTEPDLDWYPPCGDPCYVRAPVLSFNLRRRTWRTSTSGPGTLIEVARDRGALYGLWYAEAPGTVCLTFCPGTRPVLKLVALDPPAFGSPSRARAGLQPLHQP